MSKKLKERQRKARAKSVFIRGYLHNINLIDGIAITGGIFVDMMRCLKDEEARTDILDRLHQGIYEPD